jgi:hypothetical protein
MQKKYTIKLEQLRIDLDDYIDTTLYLQIN